MPSLQQEMTTFFEAHATRRPADVVTIGSGMFELHSADGDLTSAFERGRAFQQALADAGLAALSVPTEYGGRGLDPEVEQLLHEVSADHEVPHPMPLSVGLGLAVPTLLAHGTEEQRHRHIAATLRADQVWCQLFSEPEAGSDLASLRTTARLDGDHWVIDGQKVWTSFATFAHYGLLLARTDPSSRTHAGLSMFVLDMHAPGVDIRPLREMTGGMHFNEVFLDGVRVPADAMVGAPGAGWAVAMTTLGNERGRVVTDNANYAKALVQLARDCGRLHDPVIRQRLMHLWSRDMVMQWLKARAEAAQALHRPPGPEGSVRKLHRAHLAQGAAALACDLAGMGSTAWHRQQHDDEQLSYELMYSRMASIAGGTNEIQRNIIAERVLGLPREPKG